MKVKKCSTSKWNDPAFRRKYNKQWRDGKKGSTAPPTNGDAPLTAWKKRQIAKQASQVHPLMLPGCPECGGEFFIKKGGNYEPMKLSACQVCGMRFYFAKGGV